MWLPGRDWFVTGRQGSLNVMDAANGDVIDTLVGNTGSTAQYAVVPGGSLLATAGGEDDATLLVDLPWQDTVITSFGQLPETTTTRVGRAEVSSFDTSIVHPVSARVGPAGQSLFAHDEEESTIDDIRTGTEIFHAPGAPRPPEGGVGFSVASRNGAFMVGISLDRNEQHTVWSTADLSAVYRAPPRDWVIRGVSSDGSLVVLTGASATKVVRTANELDVALLDVGGGPLFQAFFSADDEFVVTYNDSREPPYFRIWEAETGAFVGDLGPFIGLTVEFTGDGERLILGQEDGTITVFDFRALRNGVPATDPAAIVRQIPAHDSPITSVRSSPDDSMVASSAFDEPVSLWDLETGRALGEFGTAARAAMAFDPVHPWLYVSAGGQVSVYALDLEELLAIAQSRLTRGMADDECDLYLRRPCDG